MKYYSEEMNKLWKVFLAWKLGNLNVSNYIVKIRNYPFSIKPIINVKLNNNNKLLFSSRTI